MKRKRTARVHDSYRIDYLRNHIKAMKDAVDARRRRPDGLHHVGLHRPRLRLHRRDAESATASSSSTKYDDGTGNLSRSRKDSFYWYKKVIATNGEDLD